MKRRKGDVFAPFVVFFLLLLLFTACNVYDGMYSDDVTSDVEKNLANADKAMREDNYGKAAQLYMAVIVSDADNARARIGYSSAILLQDVDLRDIPELMNSVYSIETNSTNVFLVDALKGAAARGLTVDQYKTQIMNACSNAAYWRSPVLGVDPITGKINTNTNNIAVATNSDGWIPVDDRTVMLNYLIIRTVHVALYVQQEFNVTEGLIANINLADYTNFNIATATSNEFVTFHINLTNQVAQLSNAYESLTNVLLTRGNNVSPYNLMDVAYSLLTVVSNSGFDTKLLETATKTLTNLTSSLNDFIGSLTNQTAGINDGFAQIYTWRTNLEYMAGTLTNWMGY